MTTFVVKNDFFQIGVVLILAGLLVGVLSTADRELKKKESFARENLLLVAYLTPSADANGATLAGDLAKKDPLILQARFQSKADALQIAQSNPAWAKALMMIKGNPLPSTISITYGDKAWTERSDPAVFLKESPEIAEVRWDVSLRDSFRYVQMWRGRIFAAYGGVLILLGFWGFFLLLQKRGLQKEAISG